jgi:hypothetical protein
MGGFTRKALLVAISLCLASSSVAFAASTARTKGAHGPAASITYSVYFGGSGSFTSTDTEATEAIEACAGATDTVVEHTSFHWDTGYTLTIPRRGELLGHSVKGAHFRTHMQSTWTQESTVTPSGCLGGNQTCSGTLDPSSPSAPAFAGDARRPELTISITGEPAADLHVQSVNDWVVAPDVMGSPTCSLYAHFHTALEPFALGSKFNPANASLTVANAMAADFFAPRSKLRAGKRFVMKVPQTPNYQPPANCATLTIDSAACSEQLLWKGEVSFKPL